MYPVPEEDLKEIERRFPDMSPDALQTDARPLLAPDATEEAWLATRRNGIGASELAVVMNRSPYASPFSLWHAKRGGWDLPQTEEQMVGLALENAVADIWARENADTYHVARPRIRLWSHPDHPWLMCSPDRLAMSERGEWIPVEVKTDEGGKDWAQSAQTDDEPWNDTVPYHYRVQLGVQCAIFDAPYGYIARLGRKTSGRKYTTYRVMFDPAEFATWVDYGRLFMLSIREGIEPTVDSHTATTAALQRLNPPSGDPADVATVPKDIALAWATARAELAKAKAISRLADNRLRAAMGGAAVAMTPSGTRFAKRSVYERAGYTVKPTTVDQLRLVSSDGFFDPGIGVSTTESREYADDIEAAPPDHPQA